MSGVLNAVVGAGGASAPTDAYFKNTTLLLHGDGTNGAQNNTFLDSSSNNFTITRNGNTTQGTFSPFSVPDGRWSIYQAAVPSDYISFTTSAGTLFQFTGDFTIESWVFPTVLGSDCSVWVTSDGSTFHALNIDASNYNIYLNSGSPTSSFAHGLILNSWNHIAMVRSGSTISVYTNGVSKGTITNSSTLGHSSPSTARAGGGASGSSRYQSNLRIVKGTAVYTSAFTPPTSPLTAITNTSLLTFQSNRFLDNSANSLAATPSGSPSVQAYSPFAPTAAYSATTNGGSGYFDGSGDYLQTPSNSNVSAWSTDFTIECWVYPISLASGPGLWTNSTSHSDGYTFAYLSSNGSIGMGRVGINEIASAANVIKINQWHHVAFVRNGSTVNIYVDGVSVASGGTTVLETSTTKPLSIAGNFQNGGGQWPGYISNFRVVKGTALYTSTFTPPTAPLTAITNTQLLLSCTNAGIKDNTAKNDLETVGNAQISTTQSKFGGSSMYFDGTASYASLVNNPINLLGDFTVEGWFYSATATTAFQGVVSFGGISSSIAPIALLLGSATSGANAGSSVALLCSVDGTNWAINAASSTGVTSNNTWYHFAVVRNSGTFTVYVNGTAVITSTAIAATTTLYSSGTINRVGGYAYSGYYYAGYLDDIRVTKGVARYTSNFTVPSAAFPDK